jgi:hypothetical protein
LCSNLAIVTLDVADLKTSPEINVQFCPDAGSGEVDVPTPVFAERYPEARIANVARL